MAHCDEFVLQSFERCETEVLVEHQHLLQNFHKLLSIQTITDLLYGIGLKAVAYLKTDHLFTYQNK